MSADQIPPACPACSFLLAAPTDYCPRCRAPLSRSSTFDPILVLGTEGELFRRGASRPSRIVVVGMWMLFGPAFFGILIFALFGGFSGVLMFSPFLLLYGAILWKVTSRYYRARRTESST
jgi:hypothetical protein